MQPRTAAEVSKWDHHGGGAGGAHEQVCGRHKEGGPQEGGLAGDRIWGDENRRHGPVQNPSQETEWAERRGQDPPECLLPRVGENWHGGTQSHQKPRRRSRDPRVLGPFALRRWGASWTVCFWEKSCAVVSSLTAPPMGPIMFLSQFHGKDTYTVKNTPMQKKKKKKKKKKKRIKISLSSPHWEMATNSVKPFVFPSVIPGEEKWDGWQIINKSQ